MWSFGPREDLSPGCSFCLFVIQEGTVSTNRSVGGVFQQCVRVRLCGSAVQKRLWELQRAEDFDIIIIIIIITLPTGRCSLLLGLFLPAETS